MLDEKELAPPDNQISTADVLVPDAEPERIYKPVSTFNLSLNMLNYAPPDEYTGFQIDWDKMVYGDDQLNQFIINKNEKVLRPDCYGYLFDPTQKTPFEKWVLEKGGYNVKEICENDIDVPILLASSCLRDA